MHYKDVLGYTVSIVKWLDSGPVTHGSLAGVKAKCSHGYRVYHVGAVVKQVGNVLVMTDVFSKYTVVVPSHDQQASTMVQVLLGEWFF